MGTKLRHRRQFPDEYFDVVVDKALMDCLFCCDGADAIVKKTVDEYHRILHDHGLFIIFSLHPADDVLKCVPIPLVCRRPKPTPFCTGANWPEGASPALERCSCGRVRFDRYVDNMRLGDVTYVAALSAKEPSPCTDKARPKRYAH